jgi:anti-sigma factor ChrR (cupin superfamily)
MNYCLGSHFPEDVLERYAMGKLSRQECVPLEEHLLICPACQTSLAAAEEYTQVVRAAIAALAPHPPARIHPQSAWALRAAATVCMAAAPLLVRTALTLA